MEPLNRIRDFLLGVSAEMVGLALVGRSGAVPEEEPLEGLGAFEFVLEAEDVVAVEFLEEVEQFG